MPKAIAIFADGTGNSAGKLFRTNVWRLYQALDTSNNIPAGGRKQIAYYHDGVGTSAFKPLALLGGAIGWGLKRNILDIYKFICRNYEPGDQIYLFGFSRGAFTVRVLASFIVREGLVADTGDGDLDAYAHDAYRAYRRCFGMKFRYLKRPRSLWDAVVVRSCRLVRRKLRPVKRLRNCRDGVLALFRKLSGKPPYRVRKKAPGTSNRKVQQASPNGMAIEFIGVWDTVAAYGTPVEELTRGIDKWIWPLSMPGYHLSRRVGTARHALALDDERDTFHPLLWDERCERSPERIRQVWFAGMHSDVGGGYPDDQLSYVPLEWMLDEAAGAGLRFTPSATVEIRRMASAAGPMHDSRRGLGGYYRYQPRKISAHIDPPDRTTLLMQDPDPRRTALLRAPVKIHESVIERMRLGTDRYAPIVLPGDYEVVRRDGTVAESPEANPAARAAGQERVWDLVWHRRVTYFASVGVSLYLAGFPLWHWRFPPSACTGPQCLLTPLISTVGEVLPGFAHPWIAAYAVTPGRFALAVLVLAALLFRSSSLQDRIRTDMRSLLERQLGLPGRTVPTRPPGDWVRRLRTWPPYQRGWQRFKWNVAPSVFAWFLILATGAAAGLGFGTVLLRFAAWAAEAAPPHCPQDEKDADLFRTKFACWKLPENGTVAAERRYRVTVSVDEPWSDDTISTSPEGFGPTRMTFWGNLLAPLRRAPDARWFQPLVKIVPEHSTRWYEIEPTWWYQIEPLDMRLTNPSKGRYEAEFTAPTSGQVYFFVNDVLVPHWAQFLLGLLPNWMSHGLGHPDAVYFNNHGSAQVEITEVHPAQ